MWIVIGIFCLCSALQADFLKRFKDCTKIWKCDSDCEILCHKKLISLVFSSLFFLLPPFLSFILLLFAGFYFLLELSGDCFIFNLFPGFFNTTIKVNSKFLTNSATVKKIIFININYYCLHSNYLLYSLIANYYEILPNK